MSEMLFKIMCERFIKRMEIIPEGEIFHIPPKEKSGIDKSGERCDPSPLEMACCITPIDSFNHVEFREELLTSPPKHSSHPELLSQLALEVINDIPDQALIIYTYGSLSDTGRAGRGIFSNTPVNDVKISIRNPDHCYVFRSELIAISGVSIMRSTLIRIVSGS
ncbi:RNase H domain-containing protein [Trichonephila clavipes]|uniref:RNase H domain-containing protein n=1 Tax=Trichonephila clavipes TaxID=2585209 RepID=A0A8X6V331_TRICX|nr:RNase H domain-containing protein [Trichonephila clavipes]